MFPFFAALKCLLKLIRIDRFVTGIKIFSAVLINGNNDHFVGPLLQVNNYHNHLHLLITYL